MRTAAISLASSLALLGAALQCVAPHPALAAEAGQGSFTVTLGPDFHCMGGDGGSFSTEMVFDDKTFNVPMPPGNNSISINFSVLGTFTSSGAINCLFDEGGTFSESASAPGELLWTQIAGDYIDRKPGIGVGDPFPFVGRSECTTTREDDFKTLCDNFVFSFNGLAKAAAPDGQFFRYYTGDFTMRAVPKVSVQQGALVQAQAVVDVPDGDIPHVDVGFQNGLTAGGELQITTLADSHGAVAADFDFPVRGTTTIDHGAGPLPFFAGGDERFVEITTSAQLPTSPKIEVCLPLPRSTDPSGVRPVRVLHGEGNDLSSRVFVDRTFRFDPTSGKACAQVSSLSKFALVTVDVCGGGQRQSDGLLTIAGGLMGKKTVVVDGLTDCTQYPANLPSGLRRYCVPDADTTPGQCTLSLMLGVNRAACNRTQTPSPSVSVNSYGGSLTQGASSWDLGAVVVPLIAGLSNPVEATVGPVGVVLPAPTKITTYKIKHQLSGIRPGTTNTETDKDALKVQCVDPTQY